MTDVVGHQQWAVLAAAQHGVFARRQVIPRGVTPRQLQVGLRCGRLAEVHRGVYRVAGAPVSWRSHVMAACLATDGVGSHHTAPCLLGIDEVERWGIHVTVDHRRVVDRPGITVHRTRALAPIDVVRVDGIPVTTAARLVVDLAPELGADELEGLVRAVIERRLASWWTIEEVARRLQRPGRSGPRAVLDLVDDHRDGLVGDSHLETRLLRLLRTGRLPRPQLQVDIFDQDGFVMRADAAWPDRGVAVEADSREHHLHEEAFEADRQKRSRARAVGWVVEEVTSRMLRATPGDVLHRIRRALDERPAGTFTPLPRPPARRAPALGGVDHVMGREPNPVAGRSGGRSGGSGPR